MITSSSTIKATLNLSQSIKRKSNFQKIEKRDSNKLLPRSRSWRDNFTESLDCVCREKGSAGRRIIDLKRKYGIQRLGWCPTDYTSDRSVKKKSRLSIESIRHATMKQRRSCSLVFPESPSSHPLLLCPVSSLYQAREILAPFALCQPTNWPRRSPMVLFVNANLFKRQCQILCQFTLPFSKRESETCVHSIRI